MSWANIGVQDALKYLERVKLTYANQSKVYNTFLMIMNEFRKHTIDTKTVIERVKLLFKGNQELLSGFSHFLPAGYTMDEPPPKKQKVAKPTEPVVRRTSERISKPKKTVEFDQAVQYVAKIKRRFKRQPQVYGRFLEILHDYRQNRTIDDVYSRVQRLFRNQPDLLNEFMYFLPDGHPLLRETRRRKPAPVPRKRRQVRTPTMYEESDGDEVYHGHKHSEVDELVMAIEEEGPEGCTQEINMLACLKAELPTALWDHFIRALNLFSNKVVTRREVVAMIHDLFSDGWTDLSERFKRALEFDEKEEDRISKASHTNYYDFINNLDFDQCVLKTKSYRQIPDDVPIPPCTQRTPMICSVINDRLVSIPVFTEGGEEFDFKSTRKNIFEANLFQCEDQRFELDMVICNIASAIDMLEVINKRLLRMPEEERVCFKMLPEYELDPLQLRSIERIYGDHGPEVMNLLKQTPGATVPVLLQRTVAKHREWCDVRDRLNIQWRKIVEENQSKSLDHRSFYFKQDDKRKMARKFIVEELWRRHGHLFGKVETTDTATVALNEAEEEQVDEKVIEDALERYPQLQQHFRLQNLRQTHSNTKDILNPPQPTKVRPFFNYTHRSELNDSKVHLDVFVALEHGARELLPRTGQAKVMAFWQAFLHHLLEGALKDEPKLKIRREPWPECTLDAVDEEEEEAEEAKLALPNRPLPSPSSCNPEPDGKGFELLLQLNSNDAPTRPHKRRKVAPRSSPFLSPDAEDWHSVSEGEEGMGWVRSTWTLLRVHPRSLVVVLKRTNPKQPVPRATRKRSPTIDAIDSLVMALPQAEPESNGSHGSPPPVAKEGPVKFTKVPPVPARRGGTARRGKRGGRPRGRGRGRPRKRGRGRPSSSPVVPQAEQEAKSAVVVPQPSSSPNPVVSFSKDVKAIGDKEPPIIPRRSSRVAKHFWKHTKIPGGVDPSTLKTKPLAVRLSDEAWELENKFSPVRMHARPSRVFVGSMDFFVVCELQQALYKRLALARHLAFARAEGDRAKAKSQPRISTEANTKVELKDGLELLEAFHDLMFRFLAGAVNESDFEDGTKKLLGVHAFVLFNIRRLVEHLVKAICTLTVEDPNNQNFRLMGLYHRHCAAQCGLRARCTSDEEWKLESAKLLRCYQSDAAALIDADVVQIEFLEDTKEIGMGIMPKATVSMGLVLDETTLPQLALQGATPVYPVLPFVNPSFYDVHVGVTTRAGLEASHGLAKEECERAVHGFLQGEAPRAGRGRGRRTSVSLPFLVRNVLRGVRALKGKAGEKNVHVENGLQARIELPSFKLVFVPGGSNVLLRRKVARKRKRHKERGSRRMWKWLVGAQRRCFGKKLVKDMDLVAGLGY